MTLRFDQVREAGSMANLLRVGDVVAWQPNRPEELKFGDLVVYQRGNRVVMHRFVGHGRIKGDCAHAFDPWTAADQDTGRVQTIVRGQQPIYRFVGRDWRDVACALISHAGGVVAGVLGSKFYAPFRPLIAVISSSDLDVKNG